MFGNVWSWDCDEKLFHQKVKLESDNLEERNLQSWMPKVGTLFRVHLKVKDTTPDGYSKMKKDWLDAEAIGSTEFDKVLILTSHESRMLALRQEEYEQMTQNRHLLQTADPLCAIRADWRVDDVKGYAVPKRHQNVSASKRRRVGVDEVPPTKVLTHSIAYSLTHSLTHSLTVIQTVTFVPKAQSPTGERTPTGEVM